jgi:ABC-type histidine transport system ATPase subunit
LGHEPEILFLDEPTSALDPEMTAEVLDALTDVQREGRTLVLATHATGFARRTGGTVAFLSNHQLEWTGPTDEFFSHPPTQGAGSYLARIFRD